MTPTAEQRQAIIREICRAEGHGPLAQIPAPGAPYCELKCPRGCGVTIYKFRWAVAVTELRERLGVTDDQIFIVAGQAIEVER